MRVQVSTLLFFVGALLIVYSFMGAFSLAVIKPDVGGSMVNVGDWQASGGRMYRNKVAQKVLLPTSSETILEVGAAWAIFAGSHNDLTYYIGLADSPTSDPFYKTQLPKRTVSDLGSWLSNPYTIVQIPPQTISKGYVYMILYCNAPDNDNLDDESYILTVKSSSGYTDENAYLYGSTGTTCTPLAFYIKTDTTTVAPETPEGYFMINNVQMGQNSTIVVSNPMLNMTFVPVKAADKISGAYVEVYQGLNKLSTVALNVQANGKYFGSYTLPAPGAYELKGFYIVNQAPVQAMNVTADFKSQEASAGVNYTMLFAGIVMIGLGMFTQKRKVIL
jgi:hypothetical protein